ncbi:MAG: hypothetical protein WCK37_03265 [Candidatus Falkowbacteria bacterium]
MIIEDENLIVKKIIEAVFEGALADERISIISATSTDTERVHRILQYDEGIDLIFCAISTESNVAEILKFVSIARFAHSEPEKIIGISECSNYSESLRLAGCSLVYNRIEACRYLAETLEFKKYQQLQETSVNA